MLRSLLAICACILAGCGSRRDDSYFSRASSVATDDGQLANDVPEKPVTRRVVSPSDPPVMFRPTVNLSIYHLRVPLGTVSGSDEFWKRVDEHAVDITTYDVLYKNGIRVGR